MHEPTYKPGTWVTFSQGDLGGFGEIIGGFFDGKAWIYHVKTAKLDGTNARITADDVRYTYEGGNWMTPNHLSGNSSVYAQVEE